MKTLGFVFLISLLSRGESDIDAHLASKAKADQIERARCGYNLLKLWTAEIAHSPFASTPLIADVDADGFLDIVAAPLSETQAVLEAETGKTLKDSRWPTQMLDSSILASPLQYDIDGDGMLDLMFVTFSGDIFFYTPNGTALRTFTRQIPPAYVQQTWYQQVVSASGDEVIQFVSTEMKQGYIPVDAHVMSTPVIVDLNNDPKSLELVIPVSYYFDEEDYRLPEDFEHINNINETELAKYVIAGVVVMDLSTLTVTHTIHLELTTKDSAFPAYILFSPTLIDMDRNGRHLEIVVGTSAGSIHVIETQDGVKQRQGFPYNMGTIHGQLTVADLNKDQTLELIAIDTSGNVVCLNEDGTVYWELSISGDNSPGSRLIDVDSDGYLDIIIPTNEGDVYAISGVQGKILDGWPIKTGNPILSNVIATHVSHTRKTLDLVFLSNDGALHVVSTDQSCRTHFPIGETSLVQILSHDLVSQSEGLELLIATNDGTLICMGSGDDVVGNLEENYAKTHMISLPAETKSPNDFMFADRKLTVCVSAESRSQAEVTGSQFHIEFTIIDPAFSQTDKKTSAYTITFAVSVHSSTRTMTEVSASHFYVDFDITDPFYVKTEQKTSLYTLRVYFGQMLLLKATFTNPGVYSVFVSAYPRPSHGHVTLTLTNKNGQIAQDTFPVRFNQIILEDLQWLLMAPFITMVIILLVHHGFPAKDFFPSTLQDKTR